MKYKQVVGCLALLVLLALQNGSAYGGMGFIKPSGIHFIIDSQPFYSNGFNAYWLMYMASDPNDRTKVSPTLQKAASLGLKVIRTWAFNDGGYRALQESPGQYNEATFQGLDYVISEAKKNGVYLILTLVNNWGDFGGKSKYVQWARDQGQTISSDDGFFSNEVAKEMYKNHIKTILTRVNTITGVAYKDEPTIFAWELMNEPRCQSDLSGKIIQAWVQEMASYVKSIDSNHMLNIGLEGYYGESAPDRKQYNPGYEVGTDFISNNQVPEIDFTTIHSYPDQWIPGSSDDAQLAFMKSWIQAHIEDSTTLQKPFIVSEFGRSSRSSGYTVDVRDSYFKTVYDAIYSSAKSGGPCTGGLFWQVLAEGMDGFKDGYEVIFSESPSTTSIITRESSMISSLNSPSMLERGAALRN
ncbi:putative mannan endo-1,4-beta-mannosidase 9 [Elaeis guineensis]|uniref:putative mannan endo-1,4-beta-mannosidase 9 n=1 Tax=Elaeis guineensis var. tenera TaxID=51953 RepID=UPI003C6D5187